MLAKLIHLNFWFSRSKLRKGPIFAPKLKDLTQSSYVQKQIRQQRDKFEQNDINETLSHVMSQIKPKLGKRFKINTEKLNRDLKKMVKLRIQPELLMPAGQDGDDLKFLEEGKSYLHDQRKQVQFQQKFQKELFMKKQTNRMIKKQQNNFKNFLPENEDNRFNKYLLAKKKLKNNRIESMMNYRRNNEQLQLLIQSGLMQSPQNLKMVINKIKAEGVHQIQERMETQMHQINSSKQLATISETTQHNQMTQMQEIMRSNIEGPHELRDYSKVQEFMQRYHSKNDEEKKKSDEDINLLLKVRQYERNLFLSRYDQINFRFRGRVVYENFKQFELLSYFKHQVIDPSTLLAIFEENYQHLSKFNIPIITPAVMSRIYSKTSTYKFSQNDENNRVNLLNHPSFVKLERTLFRELDKISDELFCDTVFSYAKNHEEQEGLLNVKMSNAIQKAIFNEINQRIGRLRSQDLGLLARSLIMLNILNDSQYNEKWGEIIEVLEHRLPQMDQSYQYQSVMELVHLLPTSHQTANIIVSNLTFFDKYKWQDRSSILTFSRIGSFLLSNRKLIDPLQHNKAFIKLKEIINNKTQEIKMILPSLNINQFSKILVVFQGLNKFTLGPDIPPILVNISKKEIVNGLHTQKHKIYQYTIPTLITTLSLLDYYKSNIMKASKYIDSRDLLTPIETTNVMKIAPLKHLLPGRSFVFNSKLFFVYHQLARLLEAQTQALSLRSIAESLFGLSLIQYKNEGMYDTMTYRMLERIQKDQKQKKLERISLLQTMELIKIVNSYSLQRRNTNIVQQIYDKILQKGKQNFKNIKINILISFFGSYVNINSLPTIHPKQAESYKQLMVKWNRNKSIINAFLYSYTYFFKDNIAKLSVQQSITLYIITTLLLNNTSRILQSNSDQPTKSDFQLINSKLKQNLQELIRNINNITEKQQLKIDYQFALSICLTLNQLDINVESIINDKNLLQFNQIQIEFYKRYIEDIMNHEQHVGTSVNYKQAYDKMINKIETQPTKNIVRRPWCIQVQDQKIVYFLATYEHLMSKSEENQTSLSLFGLWKIYAQIYRRKKWNLELVCTMLEQ